MTKQKQKSWIKRIIVIMLCSLVLVVSAPNIVNYVAKNESAKSFTAYADPANPAPATAPQAKTETQKTLDNINTALDAQRFLSRALWPILNFIGGLLDNSLLFQGGMGETMRKMWVPIRNLVNIFFVIGLVGIALYNILGLGEDGGNYGIKTVLPKLIVGIIAVNFSFLGIKVALDAVNILTTAIFALPTSIGDTAPVLETDTPMGESLVKGFCIQISGIDQSKGEITELDINRVNASRKNEAIRRIGAHYQISIDPGDDADAVIAKKSQIADAKKQAEFDRDVAAWEPECSGFELSTTGKAAFSKFKSSNAALALALNMGKVPLLKVSSLTEVKNIDDVGKMLTNTLFAVVMFILYAVSFVALLAVLLARAVVMWLSIVLSPLILVAMVVPQLKEQLGAVSKISEQFVKHLIAPIPIAFSLTVGWIMLKAFNEIEVNDLFSEGIDYSMGLPLAGLSTLQDLMIAVGCVAVVWMGVFTAAGETLAAGVTNWMGDITKRAGQFLGTAPFKYGTFLPVGGKGRSFGEIKELVEGTMRHLEEPQTKLRDEVFEKMGWNTPVSPQDLSRETTAKGYIGKLKTPAMLEHLREGKDIGEMTRAAKVDLRRTKEGQELATMIEEYQKADETKRKKLGPEILERLHKGEFEGIDAATSTAKKPATTADASKPAAGKGAKPATDAQQAATPPAGTREIGEATPEDGKPAQKYYMDDAGIIYHADGSQVRDAEKTRVEAALKDNIDKVKAAQASHLASRTKRRPGDLVEDQANGEVYADTTGAAVLFVGDKVYDIGNDGKMTEVTDAAAKTAKQKVKTRGKGTKIGTTGGGEFTVAEKLQGKAKQAAEKLRDAITPPTTE